ncbi:DUF2975 domain-containing protein [Cellulomonas sp. ATA003]|uniref:DUF2975 domain-containing protein n=1 Tax=Cellulomonas sp. ATA003 TaxID=3073064 RepID=UPI002873A557|nr:DUF2975 domain-containing protein [Cellulomonas sp. ATA003]WNB84420.1 DUF2975 domain-containing protein [Cellulomonas sp. ATA003]
MTLTRTVVVLLRVLLVLLFAACVVGQTLAVPGQFADIGQGSVDLTYLRWPLTTIGVLGLLCVEVVIVCTWKLLTMVEADRIFSTAAFSWVDGIVWAVAAAWVLLAGTSAWLIAIMLATPELRDPGAPMLLLGLVLVGAVAVMLMVVLRALLRQAAVLRTDMDAVI